jgi:hypothetical protein
MYFQGIKSRGGLKQSHAQHSLQTNEHLLGLEVLWIHLLHGAQTLSHPGHPSKDGATYGKVKMPTRFIRP